MKTPALKLVLLVAMLAASALMVLPACTAKPGVDPPGHEAAGAAAARIDPVSAGRIRPQLKPEVRTARNGDRIALVTPSGSLLKLNEVGARVALLLDGQHSLADIARALVAEYDVTEEVALRDTVAFVEQMEKDGLLAPAP